ncbi:MAG: hypothetical protein ACI31V_02145 [Bacilli bacterium]
MEFTYEELREEEKRNIEIIESCEQLKEEIDENIKNINSIIDMIKKQGELDKQIEEVNAQIATVDNNNNDRTKEILAEKRERLSQLKTLLELNQNKNESDIQMLEREIKGFEQQKVEIEEEQQKSIKKMENIVEICKEHIAELNEDRTIQHHRTETVGEITEKYAKLEEELESFKIYDGFLTKKQQQRIKEIEKEKDSLEKEMVTALPDLRQEIINKTKKSQLDLLFGVAQIQEGKALDRKNTIINSYEKVAEETNKYLVENVKQNDKEQEKSNEPEEKAIETNVEENVNKEQQPEQNDFVVTKNVITNPTDLDENINTVEEKNNDTIPQEELENLIYDEENPKEIALDEPLTADELERLSKLGYNYKKQENKTANTFNEQEKITLDDAKSNMYEDINISKEQTEVLSEKKVEESPNVSQDSEIGEFKKYLNEKEPNEPEIKSDKEQEQEDDEIYELLRALKKDAIELGIDKKIKRKVSKDKKQGRIKRFFMNIKERLNEKKANELREELEKQEQKGGRVK